MRIQASQGSKTRRELTLLLTIVVLSGCRQSSTEPDLVSSGVSLESAPTASIEFEVEPQHLGVNSRFNSEAKNYKTASSKLRDCSPKEGFDLLAKELPRFKDQSGTYLCFGVVKGELYSVDEFEMSKFHLANKRLTFVVKYTRKESHFTPSAAKAYFKITSSEPFEELIVEFDQHDETFRAVFDVVEVSGE